MCTIGRAARQFPLAVPVVVGALFIAARLWQVGDNCELIISSTFITDLATVIALSALFISPNWWLLPFVVASVALIVGHAAGGRLVLSAATAAA